MTYHWIFTKSNMVGTANGAGSYHSKAPEFNPVFSEVPVALPLVFWCFVEHCLSFSSFLLIIVLSGFQSTDYHVVIFKLSYDKLLQVIEG